MKFALKKKISNEFIGKVCIWLILLSCFYYPIGASVISFTKVPSTIVNIFIRSSFTLVSLILIFLWLISDKKENEKKIKFDLFAIFSFWIVYSIRIIYDTNNGINMLGYDNFYVYGFAFGSILIPMISISCWGKNIDLTKIPIIVFWLLLVSNVCIFLTIIHQSESIDSNIFLQRIQVDGISGSEESLLNSITLSFYGELLALSSIFHLTIYKQLNKFLLIISLFLGILLLIIGASRGPFLIFIVVSVLLLIYHFQLRKFNFVFIFKIFLGFFCSILTIFIVIRDKLILDDFYIFQRLFTFYEERQNGEENIRDILLKKAFNDFLDSPLIGKQFVSSYDNFYPHNIFVEVLMALGVVGAVLFGIFLTSIFIKLSVLFFSKNKHAFFIVVIYVPVLLGNLFSSSLIFSVDFWLLSMLIIKLDRKQLLN